MRWKPLRIIEGFHDLPLNSRAWRAPADVIPGLKALCANGLFKHAGVPALIGGTNDNGPVIQQLFVDVVRGV
ncbi:hypothetical protein D3C78_943250 [compost metagenome]